MSLLVQEQDLINIIVHYTVATNKFNCKFVKVLDENNAKELLSTPEGAAKVKMLNTKWKPQTWQAQNELFANSTVYNPSNGAAEVNWSKFRDSQLKQCLVDWDLTDDSGRAVPVTADNINMLHASVANALSNKYAEATSLDEEEQKK